MRFITSNGVFFALIMALLVAPQYGWPVIVSAVVSGEQEVKVKAKAQGEIIAFKVEEGSEVKKDTVLALLDDRQEKIERDLALAEFRMAEQDYESTKKLKKYVSQDEILNKKNAFLKKKSTYELKEYNLSNKQIIAPIDGVVTKRLYKQGETVAPGDRVFEIVQLANLVLEMHVDSKDAPLLSKGKEVTFKTDQSKDKQFKAQVTYISPVVDAASGTVTVRAALKNPIGEDHTFLVKPGIMATVEF
jgi:membrane fusion protein, multidrug efflux system